MVVRTNDIRVYSHNVAKNYLYLDVLLETLYNDFDVLFIQEPPWRTIRQVPSSSNKEGDDVIRAPMHPEWLYMVRPPQNDQAPRVMAFVSKRLEKLRPSMRTDVIDHCDIFILSLFQGNDTYNLMNVYSDDDKTAILYLRDHVDELPSFHYMGGDFNVHSSVWDPEVTHHRWAAITLLEIAADLDLERTEPSNPGPTFISHNADLRPSVIDLMFHRISESVRSRTRRTSRFKGTNGSYSVDHNNCSRLGDGSCHQTINYTWIRCREGIHRRSQKRGPSHCAWDPEHRS